MNKVKNNVRKDFTIIPNALINDDERSDRARFLFIYMASKPDDWDFYQEPLAKSLGYSVDTLRKYISELMDAGWMTREERRDEGKFDSYDYTLLPSPYGKNTDTVKNRNGKKPEREKTALYNKDYNKERLLTNKERERAPEIQNLDFFNPEKHKRTSAHLISFLSRPENKMWLNDTPGNWQRAVKGYCLKLQKQERWNQLQVPENEDAHYRWFGSMLAGIKSWYKTAEEFDKQSGRTPDAVTIKAPAPPNLSKTTRRASADEARKIAGL